MVRPSHLEGALAVVAKQLETMSHQAQTMSMANLVEGFDQKLQEYWEELEALQMEVNTVINTEMFSEYDSCMQKIQK